MSETAKRRAGSMVTAASAGGEVATAAGVVNKPADELEVFVIPITTVESIALGFRQSMFTIQDAKGNGGEVLTTGGFGGTTLILDFVDGDDHRQAAIDCADLLIRWVGTFDQKAAKAMRSATTVGEDTPEHQIDGEHE